MANNNYFADDKDGTIINASFTGKAQSINPDKKPDVEEPILSGEGDVLSGDINNANKSTIVGGRDVIGGGAKGTDATHTLGNDTIVGDAVGLNDTNFTGGADKITLEGMNNAGATVIGDAQFASGGTIRGGADSIIIEGEITGGVIIGDVESVNNTTFVAGNDNIQLKGDVSNATVYTDAKDYAGVNALSGGNDLVTLGEKPAAGASATTSVTHTEINLGIGNDNVTAYSTIGAGVSVEGGHGNDRFTVTTINGDDNTLLSGGEDNDIFSITNMDGGAANGDAGNDVFTITNLNGGKANGGADNDTFTITNMTGGEAAGSFGNDRFTVSNMSDGNIKGGAGNDTISITTNMTGGIIEGGIALKTLSGTREIFGTDSISVKNVSYAKIYGDDSTNIVLDTTVSYNDIIRVTGTSQSTTINARYGNDTIIMNIMDGGAVDGSVGNDTISISKATSGTISGGADDDKLTITTAEKSSISGDAGDDSMNITTATDTDISGGDGDDSIYVRDLKADTFGNKSLLDGGDGNDSLTVTTTINSSISAGDGENVLNLTTVTASAITSGADDDKITIRTLQADSDGNASTMNSGAGDDSITITSMINSSLDAGAGDDSLKVTTATNSIINTGTGDDSITISTWKGDGVNNYIDAGAGDNTINIVSATNLKINNAADDSSANTITVNTLYGTDIDVDLSTGTNSLKILSNRTGLNDTELLSKITLSGGDTIDLNWAFNGEFNAHADGSSLITKGLGANAELNFGTGHDALTINAAISSNKSGLTDTELAAALGAGHDTLTLGWAFNGVFSANDDDGDTLITKGLGVNAVLDFGTGGDGFISTTALNGTATARKTINTESGNDSVTLTTSNYVDINTGEGDDSLIISGTASNTNIELGVGQDTVSIGAMGVNTKLSYDNVDLDDITIKGTYNQGMVVDVAGYTTALSTGADGGSITLDTLGTGQLEFSGYDASNAYVSGNDTLTINKNVAGTTTVKKEISTLGGNDSIDLKGTVSNAVVDAGTGADTISIGALSTGSVLKYDADARDNITIKGTYNDGFVQATTTDGTFYGLATDAQDGTTGGSITLDTLGTGKLQFGDGADSLTITKALSGSLGLKDIFMQDGKDSVVLNSVNGAVISAGDNDDNISATSLGSTGELRGDAGNDDIQIGTTYTDENARKLTATMSAGTIDAGDGNDEITIGHSYSDGNILGTMSGGKVYGGAGDDVITTTTLSGSALMDGGAGEDVFNITNMSGGTINGDAGSDTVNFAGTFSRGTINAGDDDDLISINTSPNSTMSGGTINAGNGNDSIFLMDLRGGIVNGEAGADDIVITNTMTGGTINSATGDTITITSMSGGIINDSAEDSGSISITNMSNGIINGNAGADNIKITNTFSRGTINGGDGNDTVSIESMIGGTINAQNDDDNITIGTLSAGTINVGEGNNKITIEDALNGGSIIGGKGNDTLVLVDGIELGTKYNIDLGAGANEVQVNSNLDGQALTLGSTNDNVYLNKDVQNTKINLGSGNDSIEGVVTSTNAVIDLGSGNDSISLSNFGAGSIIYGGAGNDTINAAAANDAVIDLGSGNNNLDVATITNTVIVGNTGHDSIKITDDLDAESHIYASTGNDSIEIGGSLEGSITYDNRGFDTIKLASYAGTGIENTYAIASHAALSTGTDGGKIELGTWTSGEITFGNGHDTFVLSGELLDHNADAEAHELAFMLGNDSIEIGDALSGSITYDNRGLDTIKLVDYAGTGIENTYDPTKHAALSTGTDGGTIELGTWSNGDISFGNGHDKFVLSGELKNHNATEGAHELNFMNGNDTIQIGGTLTGSFTYDNVGFDSITIDGEYNGTGVSGTYKGEDQGLSTGSDGGFIHVGSITAEGIAKLSFSDKNDHFSIDTLNVAGDNALTSIDLKKGVDSINVHTLTDGTIKYNIDGFDSIVVSGEYAGTGIYGYTLDKDGKEITANKLSTGTDGGRIEIGSIATKEGIEGLEFSDKNDYFKIDQLTTNAYATMNLGLGNDTVSIGDLGGISGDGNYYKVNVELGDGSNTANVTNIENNASLTGGSGVDTITVTSTMSGTINAGNGNNKLVLNSADGEIITGSGADNISITGDFSGAIIAGIGNDSITTGASTGAIYGDDTLNNTSNFTAGSDRITVARLNDTATIIGDANAIRYASENANKFTVRGGNDSIIVEGDIAGTNSNNAVTIVGDMQNVTDAKTFTAGNDNITLKGNVSYAKIYTDSQEVINNDPTKTTIVNGGNDTLTLGVKGQEGQTSVTNSTINLGVGNDNLTAYSTIGAGTEISGGDGLDRFTVSHMQDGEINGGAHNDTFNITTMSGGTVDGGTENDTFTVATMSDGTVSGGTGNDRFTVTNMSGGTLTGDDGNDIISVVTMIGGTIEGGTAILKGTDSITVKNASNATIYGDKETYDMSTDEPPLPQEPYGDKSYNDIIKVTGISENTDIHGGYGVDNITIATMNGGTVNGQDDDDTIKVTTMNGGTINGGTEDDTITIATARDGVVSGGNGDDKITVTTGIGDDVNGGFSIDGGNGTDTITMTTLNRGQVEGGADVDTISVSNAYNSKIYGDNSDDTGDGNDIIKVTGTLDSSSIDGGAGNDSITVGTAKYSSILGGSGDDSINVTTATQSSFNSGAGEDTIFISNQIKSAVSFENTSDGSGQDQIYLKSGIGIDGHVTLSGTDGFNVGASATAGFNMSGGTLTASVGDDTLRINTLSSGHVDAGAGADSITIVTMNGGHVNSGEGDDTISITNAITKTVSIVNWGGEDNLYLTKGIASGANITLEGDAGFNVLGASSSAGFTMSGGTLTGSDNADKFTLASMTAGTLYGGAGDDTITVTLNGASKGILYGGDGADLFYINSSKTSSITIQDFSGDDSIIIGERTVTVDDVKGTDSIVVDGITVNLGTFYMDTNTLEKVSLTNKNIIGIDEANTITITGTVSNSDILTYAGADSISVATLNNSHINTGAENDNITITTINNSTISTGEGADTTTIKNTVNKVANIENTGAEKDNIFLEKGMTTGANISLSGAAGFTIAAGGDGSSENLYQGFNVAGGILNASEGADSITIATMSAGTINANGGNDSIGITELRNGTLNGGDGANKFTIITMHNGIINGGADAEIFDIRTMNNGTINGGAGADTFAIRTINGGTLNTDGGVDSIFIESAVNKTIRINNMGTELDTVYFGNGIAKGGNVILSSEAGFAIAQDINTGFDLISATLTTSSGTDSIVINELNGNLNSGSGADTMIINEMSGGNINAGNGDDSISIASMSGGNIEGGLGVDSITITSAINSSLTIRNAGAEQDILAFTGGIEAGAKLTLSSNAGFNLTTTNMTGGSIIASNGADSISFDSNLTADSISLNSGDDILTANAATGKIYGGNGNDSIKVTSIDGIINGDAGNDIIIAGTLSDTSSINGGSGNDYISVNAIKGRLDGSSGTDTLHVVEAATEAINLQDLKQSVFGFEAFSFAQNTKGIVGTTGVDTIIVGINNGNVNLGAGNDSISIGTTTAGSIDGGAGIDSINIQNINGEVTIANTSTGTDYDLINVTNLNTGGELTLTDDQKFDLSITNVAGGTLNATNGDDTIVIETLTSGAINTHDGYDSIIINNIPTGGSIDGGAGQDELNLNTTINSEINLETLTDNVEVFSFNRLVEGGAIIGTAGDDYIHLASIPTGGSIDGGDGINRLNLNTTIDSTINLETLTDNVERFTFNELVNGGNIIGTAGNDDIGVNTMSGGTINAGAGNDYIQLASIPTGGSIDGGDGQDILYLHEIIKSEINLETLTDNVEVFEFSELVNGVTIIGTAGNDDITVYYANGGTINTGAGNDSITVNSIPTGGSIDGGDGLDILNLTARIDSEINLETLTDNVEVFEFNELVEGGNIIGTAGDDYIAINSIPTGGKIDGGAGQDTLYLNPTINKEINLADLAENVEYFTFNRLVEGGAIIGTAGDDIITVSDMSGGTLSAGAGDDSIILNSILTGGTIDGGDGQDTLNFSHTINSEINLETLTDNVEVFKFNELVNGGNIIGTAGNDIIAVNTMSGGTLSAGAGNDYLSLGSIPTGGTIDGGDGQDTFTFTARIDSEVNLDALTDNVEVFEFKELVNGGNIIGTAGDDVITVDTMSGGTINAGAGNDSINVSFGMRDGTIDAGAGDDSIILSRIPTGGSIDGGDGSFDRLNLNTTINSEINLETLTDNVEFFEFNELAEGGNIIGTAGDDVINVDTMSGGTINTGAGNDSITVNSIPTGGSIDGGDGQDILNLTARIDSEINLETLTDNVELFTFNELVNGGNIIGTAGDDYIAINSIPTGGKIDGGAGQDILYLNPTINKEINLADLADNVEYFQFEELAEGGAINGTAGDDIITVSDMSGGTLNAGAGNDSIILSRIPTGGTIDGGDGQDRLNFSHTINSEINLETLTDNVEIFAFNELVNGGAIIGTAGDDDIGVGTMSGGTLSAGAGNDFITLHSIPTVGSIDGGDGSFDRLNLSTTINSEVNLADLADNVEVFEFFSLVNGGNIIGTAGDDIITVNTMSGGTINAGAGDDYIDLTSILTGGSIDGGAGDDYINLASIPTGGTIDGGDERDTLYLYGTINGEVNLETLTDNVEVFVFEELAEGGAINGTTGDDDIVVSNMSGGKLSAGAGNDFITLASIPTGGSIDGGDGQDTLYLHGTINSEINLADLADNVESFVFTDLVNGGNIIGTAGNDNITVHTMSGATINAGAGNDSIILSRIPTGGTIDGGDGQDRLNFSHTINSEINIETLTDNVEIFAFNELVNGGNIIGTAGDDVITVDTMSGGTINAGAGNDSIILSRIPTGGTIDGGDGLDVLTFSHTINSEINLETLTDNVEIFAFNELVNGGAIIGTAGDDDIGVGTMSGGTLSAGAGNDSITVTAMSGGTINAGAGDDYITLHSIPTGGSIDGGDGLDVLNLTARINSEVNLDALTDNVEVFEFFSLVNGGTIIGTAGDDIIDINNMSGGTLNAGAGNDFITLHSIPTGGTIDGGDGQDAFTFTARINSEINLETLTDNVERFIFYELAEGGNIIGTAGDDVINVDTMSGGTINAGAGNDYIQLASISTVGSIDGGDGQDTLYLYGTINSEINLETLTDNVEVFEFYELVNGGTIIGTAGNDDITVYDANGGTINTGAGNDDITVYDANGGTINTGAGYDSITVTSIPTGGSIDGGDGHDVLYINTTINSEINLATLTDNVELFTFNELVNGGNIIGTAGDDIITVNTMSGGTINAGAGNDSITVTAMSGGTINAGAGNDFITLHSIPTVGSIDGGDGSFDKLNLSTTIDSTINLETLTDNVEFFEFNELVNGGNIIGTAGNDNIRVNTMSGGTINAGAGNDYIQLTSIPTGGSIDGGDGQDILYLHGTINSEINLADLAENMEAFNFSGLVNGGNIIGTIGNDFITVNTMSGGTINAGAGNDYIDLTSILTGGSIDGGDGSFDRLNLSTTINSEVNLDALTDNVEVFEFFSLVNGGTIIGTAGDDDITVHDANGGTINTGAGDDTILAYLSASDKSTTFEGGTGADKFDIEGFGELTITDFNAAEGDTLFIHDKDVTSEIGSSSEYTYNNIIIYFAI